MIEERKDLDLLIKATESVRDFVPVSDLETWVTLPYNLMFVEGHDVGLATFEYPGVYSVHWYFESRGRKAIDTARDMITNLFQNYDAQAVRGVIKESLKASRWACRQVGLKSFGFIEFKDGPNELFCATKDEFLKGHK